MLLWDLQHDFRYPDRAEMKDVFFILKNVHGELKHVVDRNSQQNLWKMTHIFVACILLEIQAQHLITQIQFLQLLQNMR